MTRKEMKTYSKIQERLDNRMIRGMLQIGKKNLSKEQQEKFEKVINPNHQDEMITIHKIMEKYPNIPLPFLSVQMKISGYVHKIGDNLYPKTPYTDYYLVPVFQNGNFIGSNATLVFSKEVEENIKEFAEKELYKDWKLSYR